MFRRSSEALALSEASLLALRPALNTPVLNTDFLPIGPASAAVVVFAEEYGGIGLAIGLRSNENGQIAVFRNQVPLDAETPIGDALEPALADAEQMGFLFDEDLVESASGGRAEAMALWAQLMGELETPAAFMATDLTAGSMNDPLVDSSAERMGGKPEGSELLLDEVTASDPAEITLDLEHEFETVEAVAPIVSEDPKDRSAEEGVSVAPSQPLTKFRGAAAGKPAEPVENTEHTKSMGTPAAPVPRAERRAAEGRSALGRVPLVRISQESTKRVPFIARLLSSF